MSKSKLSFWTATVALAGFLFGFDTVVISGANLPIKELWNTSPLFHGTFIMSMELWGTVIGAISGGIPTNIFGRKKTLFIIGILYGVSAIGSALAPDPYSFSLFRFIGGIGVGVSSVAATTYLSEISPAEKRGRLVARYQFMIVFGILIAFFSNYLFDGVGGQNDWRFMLGVEAIPAIVYTIMVLYVPESPAILGFNRLHHQFGHGGLCILLRCKLSFSPVFYFALYCFTCSWPGSSDLGVYCGDIPEQGQGIRAILRSQHTLVICSIDHLDNPCIPGCRKRNFE